MAAALTQWGHKEIRRLLVIALVDRAQSHSQAAQCRPHGVVLQEREQATP